LLEARAVGAGQGEFGAEPKEVSLATEEDKEEGSQSTAQPIVQDPLGSLLPDPVQPQVPPHRPTPCECILPGSNGRRWPSSSGMG
jgi:hypothetical protein